MFSNKNKLLLYTSLAIIFIGIIYFNLLQSDNSNTDLNLINRRIETPTKLLLNGYLGHFFNFKYLGNINWLIIPLIIFAFFKLKYFTENWRKSLLLVYFLSLFLISIKGYFNSRYQITLLPVTLSVTLYFLWLYLEQQGLNQLKKPLLLLLCVCLAIGNNIFGWLFLKQKAIVKATKPEISLFEPFNHLINRIIYYEKKQAQTPYPIIEFINKEIPNHELLLINNLPLIYYYTNKKGIYYWCGNDTYYTKEGASEIIKNRTIDEISTFVKDSLSCNYLLSTIEYNKYNSTFEQFTIYYCKPLFIDKSGLILYEITTKRIYKADSLDK